MQHRERLADSTKFWFEIRLDFARAKFTSRGIRHRTSAVPSFDMYLEGLQISLDIISEVGSIKESEIMELDFIDYSNIVGSVRDV